MADLKISQLTGATTPLAGTEVLPVVQSSTTKKVSVADLTAGRTVSVASLLTTGNLGVKNNSPTTPVMVNTNAGGEPTYRGDVVINQGGSGIASSAGLEFKVDSANSGYGSRLLSYYDGGSAYNIAIQMRNNSAAWTTRLDLLSTGDVTVNTGNLVIGTAGKGIDFSADPSAAGMTSELLDDYEEGTFTPAFSASVSNPTVTYGLQRGAYCKVGGMVLVEVYMSWSAFSGGSGSILINLPFTVLDNPGTGGSGAISSMNGVTLDASRTYAAVSPQANTTTTAIRQLGSGSVSGDLAVSNVGASGYIIFATTYRVK